MTVHVCQWCRQPVARPVWWDGLPQCPDVFRCERRRRAAVEVPERVDRWKGRAGRCVAVSGAGAPKRQPGMVGSLPAPLGPAQDFPPIPRIAQCPPNGSVET